MNESWNSHGRNLTCNEKRRHAYLPTICENDMPEFLKQIMKPIHQKLRISKATKTAHARVPSPDRVVEQNSEYLRGGSSSASHSMWVRSTLKSTLAAAFPRTGERRRRFNHARNEPNKQTRKGQCRDLFRR
jgi:hypothetical protein